MSLQDDIARYAEGFASDRAIDRITAGLERDYYLVKLADLPEVTREGSHWSVDGQWLCADMTADDARHSVRTYAALALHLESRESEAARLEARRDRVVHEIYRNTYGDDVAAPGYTDAPDLTKTAVDSIVNLAEKLESGS